MKAGAISTWTRSSLPVSERDVVFGDALSEVVMRRRGWLGGLRAGATGHRDRWLRVLAGLRCNITASLTAKENEILGYYLGFPNFLSVLVIIAPGLKPAFDIHPSTFE